MLKKMAPVFLLLFAGVASPVSLATITIDGLFADWDSVLSDSDNILADPFRSAGDGDAATISSDPDDIRLVAATWNPTYFFFYFLTSKANASSLTFNVYVDADHDGKLENSSSADRVLSYKYVSSGIQSVARYYYNPVSGGGDTMGGDGSAMPGTVTEIAPAPSSMTGAISSSGVEYEARISWADLGGAVAPIIKISTQGGSNVLDNTGLLDLLVPKVSMTPNNSAGAAPGSIIQYTHTATNLSTGSDVLNISAVSTQGLPVSFERWNGSAFVSMLDADSNGVPDAGSLSAGDTALLRVTIFIPSVVPTQTVDVTTVVASSSVNSSVTGSATNTTYIGIVTVSPNQSKNSVAGLTIGYKHEIANHAGTSFTLSLSTSSLPGWATAIYVDSDCNGVGEGAPIASIAVNANTFRCVVVAVTIPGGTLSGTVHTVTLTATNAIPALSASATDTTTVADPVDVSPDGTSTITGAGASTYYDHTVTNNQTIADSFNLTAVPTLSGWTTQVFAEDGSTPISMVGPLAAFGGSAKFKVKVVASSTAVAGDVDVTTVTASSTSGPATDSAMDTTTIHRFATYFNFAATLPHTEFSPCSVVYAKGFNFTGTDYQVSWYDSGAVLKSRIQGVRPNGNNQVIDSYQLLPGDALGAWTVEIKTKTGSTYGNPAFTAAFTVLSSGSINALATNRASYFYQGNTITVTSTLTNNISAPYNNSEIRYVIYRDADSSNTPTNGEIFLTAAGGTASYDGANFSHVTSLVDVPALSIIQDQFSIANANFGSANTGTWKVYAEWKTSCSGNIANTSALTVTFTVAGSCAATSAVSPVFLQKSGVEYLVTWTAVSDPCFQNYVLLGSPIANPVAWDSSLLEASTSGVFHLGDLADVYYQVLVQSIDGTYGPR